jgi:hypothetical protein
MQFTGFDFDVISGPCAPRDDRVRNEKPTLDQPPSDDEGIRQEQINERH